ncbi:MAG: GHKL domain-containing protein, partial [Spirochaetes bacterium]|nr:GHKL domain-containing protein [Spirochaetota bacterium]
LQEHQEVCTTSEPEIDIDLSGVKPEIILFADKKQFGQIFTNLFKNAIEAMDHSGSIRVLSSLIKKGNSSYCRIQVQDDGPGISPENFEKVFNPYYTTKSTGTGLGLSIVERIVFDHKGSIWFESQLGYGTTFFLDLLMEKNH